MNAIYPIIALMIATLVAREYVEYRRRVQRDRRLLRVTKSALADD